MDLTRYQVFDHPDRTTARFSAPFLWIATLYTMLMFGKASYFSIVDTKCRTAATTIRK